MSGCQKRSICARSAALWVELADQAATDTAVQSAWRLTFDLIGFAFDGRR